MSPHGAALRQPHPAGRERRLLGLGLRLSARSDSEAQHGSTDDRPRARRGLRNLQQGFGDRIGVRGSQRFTGQGRPTEVDGSTAPCELQAKVGIMRVGRSGPWRCAPRRHSAPGGLIGRGRAMPHVPCRLVGPGQPKVPYEPPRRPCGGRRASLPPPEVPRPPRLSRRAGAVRFRHSADSRKSGRISTNGGAACFRQIERAARREQRRGGRSSINDATEPHGVQVLPDHDHLSTEAEHLPTSRRDGACPKPGHVPMQFGPAVSAPQTNPFTGPAPEPCSHEHSIAPIGIGAR